MKIEPVKLVVKEKEAHEKYFEGIAGSEDKAKPFLEVYSSIQKKKAEDKMENILRKLVDLVKKSELDDETKEENILRRLCNFTSEDISFKSLKDSVAAAGSFSKNKQLRQQN